MKILYFALFLVLYYLIVLGLTKMIRKLAYSIQTRYLHCRNVIAVLVLLLASSNVYTISYPMELLDSIINSPELQNILQTILPNRAFELLFMLLMIMGLNLMALMAVLSMLGAMKLIFRDNGRFVEHDELSLSQKLLHFPWALARPFYDAQDDDSGKLNSRGYIFGLWVDGFRYAFGALSVIFPLVLAISILWGSEEWNMKALTVSKSFYLLPMGGYMLMQQLHLMLEAEHEDEAGSFGTSEIKESLGGSMRQLYEAYPKIFSGSGALMFSAVSGDSRQIQGGLGSNELGNRQISDCKQPDVLRVISSQLQQCGDSPKEAYQNALVTLLNGKSVNICSDCQGDFLPVLTAYLNFYLAQGKTALVLCGSADSAERICRALNTQMHKLNNLYNMWNIRTLEGAEDNSRLSILVCSADDFQSHQICGKRKDFVDDLFCTVIADGVEIFSKDSIRVEKLFGELRKLDGMGQYILFSDVNNDALRTAMEQVCKQEILPFHNDRLMPDTYILAWHEESYYKLQQYLGIGNSLSPYMGTALPLALVAAQLDLPQMYLIPHPSRGDETFQDVMTMSSREVMRFVARNVNLQSVIRRNPEEALDKRELAMLIAYDTDYNFLNALWRQIRNGGTRETLLHVISPPYMLREYFASNFKELLQKNNEFDAMITYHLGMKVSHMAVLLTALCSDGLTEKELMDKSKEYGWDYTTVESLLKDCLSVVLTGEEIHSIHECFRFEEEKQFLDTESRFVTSTRVRLTDTTICRRLREKNAYGRLVTREDQYFTLPVLRSNLHNYYLRGQYSCFDGHLYQIHGVHDGDVYAEQVMPQDVPSYYQVSELAFDDYHIVDKCVDSGFLDLNICTADITRRIWGYWSGNRGNSFGSNCNLQIADLRDPAGAPVEDRFENAGVLEINIRKDVLGDKAEETARLLAYMLKELSKTLFPATHQNLFTAIAQGQNAALYQNILSAGRDSSLEDMVCSLIPLVTNAPESNPEFITVYVAELSGVEYGMVQMLHNRFQSVLRMLKEYLNWYVQEVEAAQENSAEETTVKRTAGSYLNFGSDAIPAVLDAQGLLTLLRKLITEEEEIRSYQETSIPDSAQICTFCERPTIFPVLLSDGRCMCAQCKDHQITQKEEIKNLFTETCETMIEGYDISLPKNMHVRFQSAEAIARATDVTGGRVLGFYAPAGRSMWLEARGPRIAMQATLIHELTHAWQFNDRQFQPLLQKVLRKFPKKKRPLIRLLLVEGHAVCVEIDAMGRLKEEAYTQRLHKSYVERQDEYGVGYRLVSEYIKTLENDGSHVTPFVAILRLMQAILDGEVTVE